jgi:hypothetical protein
MQKLKDEQTARRRCVSDQRQYTIAQLIAFVVGRATQQRQRVCQQGKEFPDFYTLDYLEKNFYQL